jgi:hypothetical protein
MKINRFRFGTWASFVWLAVMIAVVASDIETTLSMAPNEWGDFFAGVFAPLAFLWLVLGYLQQGEELQLSTETLRLQAEELKNSVEQQRQLVEVTRLQLESERESYGLERAARREAAKPIFTFRHNVGSGTSAEFTNSFLIQNVGSTVTNVVGVISGSAFPSVIFFEERAFPRSHTIDAKITRREPWLGSDSLLTIDSIDGSGIQGRSVFSVDGLQLPLGNSFTFRPAEV